MWPAFWGWFGTARNISNFKPHHNDGWNLAFVDGHAKYYKATSVTLEMMGIKVSNGATNQLYNPNRTYLQGADTRTSDYALDL